MMPSMSKVKDILIDAEAALRALYTGLPVSDETVEELKFRDDTYYVMLAKDDAVKYFTVDREFQFYVAIDASAYGLGTHDAMELTEFVPDILQTIAEDQA